MYGSCIYRGVPYAQVYLLLVFCASPCLNRDFFFLCEGELMGGLKGKKMIHCISIDNGIYESVISIFALFRLIMEKNKTAPLSLDEIPSENPNADKVSPLLVDVSAKSMTGDQPAPIPQNIYNSMIRALLDPTSGIINSSAPEPGSAAYFFHQERGTFRQHWHCFDERPSGRRPNYWRYNN